MKKNQIT